MLKKKNFASKSRATILPEQYAKIVSDAGSIVIIAISAMISISLFSYDAKDPNWLTASDSMVVHNYLGVFGAYFSNILLSCFGYTIWVAPSLLLMVAYSRFKIKELDFGGWYNLIKLTSSVVIVLSLSGLDYYMFFSATNNLFHGGIIGSFLYYCFCSFFGMAGGFIILLVSLLISSSLYFTISWINISESIGGKVLDLSNKISIKSPNLSAIKILKDKPIDKIESHLPQLEMIDMGSRDTKNPIAQSPQFYDTKIPEIEKTIVNEVPIVRFHSTTKNEKSVILDEIVTSNYNGTTDDKINNIIPELEPEIDVVEQIINIINPIEIATNEDESYTNQVDKADVIPDYIINSPLQKQPSYTYQAQEIIPLRVKAVKQTSPQHSIPKVFYSDLLPSLNLLEYSTAQQTKVTPEMISLVSNTLVETLSEFNVATVIDNVESGPVVTRYEFVPPKGVRGEKISNLSKELARSLALTSVRVVENIPGKVSMGIEVPNYKRQMIYLRDIFDSTEYNQSGSFLTLALGKDVSGQVVTTDLAKMPHLLVAGTTGSGKSVAVNTMILSILYKATPSQVKFIMIDPKMVELSFYQDIPHLLAPVVTDMTQAANALRWVVGEMETRYRVMSKSGTKNIIGFNEKIKSAKLNGIPMMHPFISDTELDEWPYIVVIIDELADLMMVAGKKIEQYIARIAQKARAVGIHLIVATQRPSVDVITGLIKANIPARISFQVATKIDSRTILDQAGGEALLGQGDMLFLSPGSGIPRRIHGAFVNDNELHRVVDFLKTTGKPSYEDSILTGELTADLPGFEDDSSQTSSSGDSLEKDPLYDQSLSFLISSKRCSISALQTQFGIGYNKAARFMAYFEKVGVVRRTDRGTFELLLKDIEISN